MDYRQRTIRNKGFTLIELLMVVAIIGLLSVLVLLNMSDTKARSRDVRRVIDIRVFQQGLALYYNNHQYYPLFDGFITGDDAMSSALINDELMSSVPIDPLNRIVNGVEYKYHYQSVLGLTYLLEYNLETDTVQSKFQGLNTAGP